MYDLRNMTRDRRDAARERDRVQLKTIEPLADVAAAMAVQVRALAKVEQMPQVAINDFHQAAQQLERAQGWIALAIETLRENLETIDQFNVMEREGAL